MDIFILLTSAWQFWALLLIAVIFLDTLVKRICGCIKDVSTNKEIAKCFDKFLKEQTGGKTDGHTSVSSSEESSK